MLLSTGKFEYEVYRINKSLFRKKLMKLIDLLSMIIF